MSNRRGMGSGLRGILFDLDETLYSREAAFWGWLDAEVRSAAPTSALDRGHVAELDQCGRGDKAALLFLDEALGWGASPLQRLERFRVGIAAAARLAPLCTVEVGSELGIPSILELESSWLGSNVH